MSVEAQVREALDAIHITPDREVFWMGQSVDTIRTLPDELVPEALISFLSRLLYRAWYVYGRPRRDLDKTASDSQARPPSRSPHFVRALLAANTGEPTYRLRLPGAGEFVEVGGVRVPTAGLPSPAVRSDDVELRISGLSLTKSPGYVMFTSGDGPPCADDADPLMRVYWNVTRTGALALVSGLGNGLSGRGVRYQFKVVHADWRWPERADTAVLYITRSSLTAVWDVVESLRIRMASMLRPYTPSLTVPISDGVGLAEDPGDGGSFGTFLCDLLAREIVMQFCTDGRPDPAALLSAAMRKLDGLGRFGIEGHAEQLANMHAAPVNSAWLAPPSGPTSPTDWLVRADSLGRTLAKQAVWDGDRCTWLATDAGATGDRTMRGMTANLYEGTAGIGLALAQLYAYTHTDEHRVHARGATLQALATARATPGLGLYTGRSGVGLAAVLSGMYLDDDDLVEAGRDMACIAAAEHLAGEPRAASFDLIDGAAGLVLVLIELNALGATESLDLAIAVADHLVEQGVEHTDGGVHWLDAKRKDELGFGFVGLAHGASGCALALSRLAPVVGVPDWTDAAVRACRYERSWFDVDRRNWLDTRVWLEGGGQLFSGRPHGLYRFDWCYGAPGILLSRLAVLGHAADDADVAEDALAAMQQTRRAAERFPDFGHASGICHGAGGLAEILSLLPAGWEGTGDATTVQRLTEIVVTAAESDSSSEDLGLMMGTAGSLCLALRRHSVTALSPALPFPSLSRELKAQDMKELK